MNTYQTLKLDINEGIGIITLNRAESLNAFNALMAVDLLRAFEHVGQNTKIRAVLLRGEGPAFSVGGDINEFASKLDELPANIPDTIEVLNAAITTLQNIPKPVLASVQGAVAGVGISLIAGCDLVIAASTTQFILAYTKIGVTPDGGASYFLPRMVGQRRAMQMALLPEKITAAQALEWGLINWVVADEQLTNSTADLIGRLANGPSIALARVKQLLNNAWDNSLDDQLQAEKHAFIECTLSKDFTRGVQAFMQKKSPLFCGE